MQALSTSSTTVAASVVQPAHRCSNSSTSSLVLKTPFALCTPRTLPARQLNSTGTISCRSASSLRVFAADAAKTEKWVLQPIGANGRSNRKEACKHLYVATSSFGSSEDDSSLLPSEEIKIDLNLPRRRLQISFTCDACGVRSQRIINPHAYTRGTVFVQCAGCEVYHKLVDNLGLIEEIDFRLETDPKVGLEEAILDNEDQTFDTL